MSVRLMTAVGILAVAGTALGVGAQEVQERRRMGPAGGPQAGGLRAELGLSPEQSTQLDKIRAGARKLAIRHRADVSIARIELEELMNAPTVDQKAIDAKVKAISDLQAAQLRARIDERLAVRRVLTPEQQEKMKELRQRRGARPAGAWRERRPGRPGEATPPPGPGGPSSGDESDPPVEP